MSLRAFILAAVVTGTTSAFSADLVVVANPASNLDQLSREDVVNLYMGRVRRLVNGAPVYPVDLTREGGSEKSDFYQHLLGRELAEIKAYWVRLTFSGQASPPLQATSSDQVLDFVGRNPGAIGYVDRSKVDNRVRVVFALEP